MMEVKVMSFCLLKKTVIPLFFFVNVDTSKKAPLCFFYEQVV